MNRDHGSRLVTRRSAQRSLGALGALALGALAIVLLQPAAHANSAGVTMGDGTASPISIYTGDSVTFYAPASVKGVTFYTGMTLTGPGAGGVVKAGTGFSIPFGGTGSVTYTWKCKCIGLKTPSGGVSIQVTSPPPPPDSSTPVDPSSSDPGGGPSGTPTGTPTGTTTPTGTPTGTGAHPSGSTSNAGGGGGISIGPGGSVGGGNDIPIGFNGPPRDPNNPTPTIPNPIGTGAGQIPTGSNVVIAQTPSTSQGSIVEVSKSTPVKSRPTSLAIIAIAALAIVSSMYAYRRLGEQAVRAHH